MKKFLVISPHPDDLDFACAGTVAQLAAEGNEVSYLIVSDGSKGTRGITEGELISKEKLIQMRKEEQREAAGILGVDKVIFLGFEDGEIENTKELRRELVKIIRKRRPDIIFSFDPANLRFDSFHRSHRDHRMAAEAAFDAIYPATHNKLYFPELIHQGYEPHRIKEVWFFAAANPDKFVDITDTIDKKIAALSCHTSQIPNISEISELVKTWANELGREKGYQYAEAFRKVELRR